MIPMNRVAPRAGAWIETEDKFVVEFEIEVAPRAGAWIETREIIQNNEERSSRPPRGGVD